MSGNKVLYNIVGFQIGWFACVYFAAQDQAIFGVAISLLVVLVHFALTENKYAALLLLIVVTIYGSLWDSYLTINKILVFNSGMINENLAPYWIMTMWALFSTTLNVSLRWLYGRYWLAIPMGAIFGPLAYFAGEQMGAVTIPDPFQAILFLAISWSILLPFLIKTADMIENCCAQYSTSRSEL
jgi:hypothetical protein